jgi:hypothetical protein
MKVSELAYQLMAQPHDQEVVVIVDGHALKLLGVNSIGSWSADNGETPKVVIYAETTRSTTTEEIIAMARNAADKVTAPVTLSQRIFLPKEQLTILLMDAFARGFTAGCDFSASKLPPGYSALYRNLRAI